MYLAISAVAVLSAAVAGVMTVKHKRLSEKLRDKTVEAESFQLAAKEMERRANRDAREHMTALHRIEKLKQTLSESEDTACRLREELRQERKTANDLREELALSEQAHDLCTKNLWDAREQADALRQERRKLNEALIGEREAAEHWKEEFRKEQAIRLSTEGRIMREVNNLLRYDGTGAGQEDVDE